MLKEDEHLHGAKSKCCGAQSMVLDIVPQLELILIVPKRILSFLHSFLGVGIPCEQVTDQEYLRTPQTRELSLNFFQPILLKTGQNQST